MYVCVYVCVCVCVCVYILPSLTFKKGAVLSYPVSLIVCPVSLSN